MAPLANTNSKEIRSPELDFAKPKRDSEITKRCLWTFDTGKWALDLGVSERCVQLWKAGQVEIPAARKLQIIKQAKAYFLDQHGLEEAIDRMLLEQYGKADHGRF